MVSTYRPARARSNREKLERGLYELDGGVFEAVLEEESAEAAIQAHRSLRLLDGAEALGESLVPRANRAKPATRVGVVDDCARSLKSHSVYKTLNSL